MARSLAALAVLALLLLAGCAGQAPGKPASRPSDDTPFDSEEDTTEVTEAPQEDPDPATAPTTTAPSAVPSSAPSRPTPAPNDTVPAPALPDVTVAVLDTGIRATHKAFAPGQIVAWYDFGAEGGPDNPSMLWDPRVEPYDEDGHGTMTASMVGGISSDQTPSHAPGVRLAIAKISGPGGSAYFADMRRAMVWATDVVKADVISLSFYSYLPSPAVGSDLLAAIAEVRAKGVLPVVLAGNGMDNTGLPTLSWMHPPATSPDALVVGGAGSSGFPQAPLGSMDPEVTALYSPTVACIDDDECFGRASGTSFSTPLVAGMAARLVMEALDLGEGRPTPDRLETVLKRAALDTLAPPDLEGYGYLDETQLEVALEAIRTGTDPPRPDPDASAIYVETVAAGARAAWSGRP